MTGQIFDIGKIAYEGPDSKNPFAFQFYNKDEVIAGKKMSEHLKFSMAYWHTLVADGTDMFGVGTTDKSFGESDPLALAKKKVYAAFELMDKLGIEYFCFHDRDIAPEGKNLAEFQKNLDCIVPLIKEQMQTYGIKLLWGTANCFASPKYMHGAATSCSAEAFACTAAQVKKAIDITIELGGKGYVFWGGREGYETLLNTDMALEQDNYARFLKMAVLYARAKGYDGDFYIEPKPKEPTKHQYDFDAATVLAFLRKYGLEKDFKLNIEANHATLAGHTFEHELCVCRINGVFGSVDANQGDPNLGWDTDNFPTDVYSTTLAMLEILRAGGFTNGGLNFDAKTRRPSNTPEDIFLAHIAGMDAFALGLRNACKIIADGRIDEFVKERYASYHSGIGAKILSGSTDLEELSRYALALDEVKLQSGRQEYLESVVNGLLFG